jgi:hypothetical protein
LSNESRQRLYINLAAIQPKKRFKVVAFIIFLSYYNKLVIPDMKKLTLILCIGLVFAACKKTNDGPYMSQGVILGYDLRECPSPLCGGLEITIKSDTAKNPPPFYHINSTLQQLGISESTKFPINVNLNYKPDTGIFKTYHYIVVTQINVIK